ncbi:MAG: uroporphyrinogen-III synthase [Acidobacteria bacterium]|nr:uroporphyrinogen-III synthase [Acidobacteriota bacterium]
MSRYVLVTRSEASLDEIRAALAPHAIEAFAYPVLRDAPIEDVEGWDRVAAALGSLRMIAMTSARAADPFRRGALSRGLWPTLGTLPVAAVGRATARAAEAVGLRVELTGNAGAAALVGELAARLVGGAAAVHPCGRDRRDELGEGLRRAVVPVAVYAMDTTPVAELPELPAEPPLAVLLSSPRAARAYAAAAAGRFAGVPHLAMGATTAAAAAELGLAVATLAHPTPDALVEELCQICS